MSKYNPKYYKEWYQKNRERLLLVRRAYNKKYSVEHKDDERIRNSTPERKKYRKSYKHTEAGRLSNSKYRSKQEVKLRYENYRLVKRYGITYEEYEQRYLKQNGCCAICGKHEDKLHIDHDHLTGEIRGLLCGSCNRGIGMFHDDVALLTKTCDYLNGTIH